MRRHYLPITIVAAAIIALMGLACSVSFDKTVEDTDFKVNIRDVPTQAHKAKLEIFDLNYLRATNARVTSVEEKRIGSQVDDYYVAGEDGNAILVQQTEIVPVEGGRLNRTMYITTDHLGDLFLHLVMLDKNDKPYSHVCSCRKKALKVERGAVLTMPGKSMVENPDLHDSLCTGLGVEDCFSCGDLLDDEGNLIRESVNLPCWLSNVVEDGDDDSELTEGEDTEIDDIDTDGNDDITDGDTTEGSDDTDTVEETPVEEEEILPVGKDFQWEAEDTINVDESQPSGAVTTYDGSVARFYGDIMLLGGDADTAAGLQDGDFLRFDFIVDFPGLYQVFIMPVLAEFHGKAKFFIDGEPANDSIFDIDMYGQCQPPFCDSTLFPFTKPGTFTTLPENVFLSYGEHTMTVVVAGRSGMASGKGIGLDHVKFLAVE